MVRTIYWGSGGTVEILDQAILPIRVEYISCKIYEDVIKCIKDLNIRGAPAIGIATAMGIALWAYNNEFKDIGEFEERLVKVLDDFIESRPTAVNIKWACERIALFIKVNKDKSIQEIKNILVEEAKSVLDEDIEINRQIGVHGSKFIKDGARILTHCNAGALATGGIGTATAPIRQAFKDGKSVSVFADETRPVLQGARLTAWELMEDNIPVTLICDNSAGALMKAGEIDLCIVGTDRTVKNGDVANKIGTYSVAVLAHAHGIPFYVAAPTSSIDFTLESGDEIPIEQRSSEEVTRVFGACQIAPTGVKVRNMAFDVTPAKYVSAIITEKGAFKPADLEKLEGNSENLDKFKL